MINIRSTLNPSEKSVEPDQAEMSEIELPKDHSNSLDLARDSGQKSSHIKLFRSNNAGFQFCSIAIVHDTPTAPTTTAAHPPRCSCPLCYSCPYCRSYQHTAVAHAQYRHLRNLLPTPIIVTYHDCVPGPNTVTPSSYPLHNMHLRLTHSRKPVTMMSPSPWNDEHNGCSMGFFLLGPLISSHMAR